jgi:hypothetical protein
MIYRFRCDLCARRWEQDVSNAALVKCSSCARRGRATKVTYRKKRSDATRPGRTMGTNELNVHSRPLRQVRPPQRLASVSAAPSGSRKRSHDDVSGYDFDDPTTDDSSDASLDDAMDSDYLPSPEFSIDMRYSAGGSFVMMRSVTQPTIRKTIPWIGITAPAGRGNTNAQFGGQSATDHARQSIPGTREEYEWCHLVADSLGGPTDAANLFCGSYHANTAMLCIENMIRGKTHLEVQIEVDVRTGTNLGERVVYRIRKKRVHTAQQLQTADFTETIDALASGCTSVDGAALSGRVRTWLSQNRP